MSVSIPNIGRLPSPSDRWTRAEEEAARRIIDANFLALAQSLPRLFSDAGSIPNIDAAKITTGTMATARLGSGAASSTTFLRGDQTYAAPVGLVAGLTTGTIPKASSATALANSILSESGNLLVKKATTGIVLALDTTGTGDSVLEFKTNGTGKWQQYAVQADNTLRFFSEASSLDRLILASAKPAVTGSRGGNAALASLLTTLANMALITDSTTV